jgi:hypothetical protein
MRTALTHARDWSCFVTALAFLFYITLAPQRPAETFGASRDNVIASLQVRHSADAGASLAVADGTALPRAAR